MSEPSSSGSASLVVPSFGSHLPLPLASMICNWSRRAQDGLFDALEAASARAGGLDEHDTRRRLFKHLTNAQRQAGQVFAIVKWMSENHAFLDRLADLTAVLDRRTGLLEHTCESLQILQRRVEDRLYPLWDVFTALHVMSTGTYRLLPGIIETRLLEEHQLAATAAGHPATDNNPLRPPITEEIIDSTIARLNNALHQKLLATELPVDLAHIDIRDGIAFLTYGQEFEIGVSLRMGPAPADAAYVAETSEESRVHWRLYELRILMNVDQQSSLTTDLHHASAAPLALFNDQQLLHLNVLLNTVSTGQPNPIATMCHTMHHLVLVVLMDILHQQSVSFAKLFATLDIIVEYAQASKILSIKYWRDTKEMPTEGAAPQSALFQQRTHALDPKKKDLLSPCLQILLDEHDCLSIRHNPPLPPSAEFPALFSLNLKSISVTCLLANVLMHHGNQRVEQLFAWIAREAREKGRKVVCIMDMEVASRTSRTSANEDQIEASLKQVRLTPSLPHGPVVPRSYLVVRLLPGYTISIHTDTQSGRFLMEWSHQEGPGGETSNLNAFYGGTASPLNRMLHAETCKLNQHIATIYEIIVHLKMVCLTVQLAAAASRCSNQRLRVYTTQPPFNAQPTTGIPAAAFISQKIRHIVFDPLHYKQYTQTPTAQNTNELFRRPGFGPHTVFLQLAGYSTNYFVVLQLNPFAQLSPSCYLVQTDVETPKVPPAAPGTIKTAIPQSTSLPVVRHLIDLKWPSLTTPVDPSLGFTAAYHTVLAKLMVDAESAVPLLILRRDLQINFHFIVREVGVVCRVVDPKGSSHLPQSLLDIVQQKTLAVERAGATIAGEPCAPHLQVTLNFPLTFSLHNPAHVSMDVLLDPANPLLRQDAHLLIYATPPRLFPDAGSATSSWGFVVYFTHPLVPKVMSLLRECDATAAASPAWQQVSAALSRSSGGPWQIDQSTGVVTLVYDNISISRLSRLVYDLDNLYVHLCYVSNFTKQVEANIMSALVNEVGMSDEIVEHDLSAATNNTNGVVHSAHTKATSLNPTYFPSDFFRCIEFSCNQLTFAYINPTARDTDPISQRLCHVVITREHRREVWKHAKAMTVACMYPSAGGPPRHLLPADTAEYRITLTPLAWPQLPFYTLEFNANRPNNVLTLLHQVWLAHRTMPPIFSFLADTQRWQAMADLTNNHQLLRLYNSPGGSRVHFMPESSTRIRLMFGQQDRGRISEALWRTKTDLRLLYEGEVVQDFKMGTPTKPAPGQEADVVRPGKIAGDISQYLHQWYKRMALDEFQHTLRQVERSLRGDTLLCGAQFNVRREAADVNLATPSIQLSFTPPTEPDAPHQLIPAEQHALSAYFAHRLASPPYLSEPLSVFYRLLAASPTLPDNRAAMFHNLRLLIGAWALELLQPHPFPQPFPQPFDQQLLRQVSDPLHSPENAPLTFRFVLHHRATFEMGFSLTAHMFSCTIEVMETKYLKAHRDVADGTNGHNGTSSSASSRARPFSLYLPLAYHIDSGSLYRWDVPARPQGGPKHYVQLPTMPPTFSTLAAALHTLSHMTMDQLVDWASTPLSGSSGNGKERALLSPHTLTTTPTSSTTSLQG